MSASREIPSSVKPPGQSVAQVTALRCPLLNSIGWMM
jgi:hypothetical protein